jgi:hypothetical protein
VAQVITPVDFAQQSAAPDRLIEDSVAAGFRYAAWWVKYGITAIPGGG